MERSSRERIPVQLAEIGQRAEQRVTELLDAELVRWSRVAPELADPIAALAALVAAGGKRLRPAFCHWGYVGAGGSSDDARIVDAGAAIELLHTFALVHDDVMDGSDMRRGQASVHRRFVNQHRQAEWGNEPRRFGEGSAILVGDFAFVYADQLLRDAPVEARAIFDELRLELCVGQYLDLAGTAARSREADAARRIAVFKSGKYTVERPLHLGAALAGRYEELGESLSRIGLPLGEAFQMRDDLLGVYGDSSVTGKPVGDDLREGKLTPLVAYATERADAAQRQVLDQLGTPDLTPEEIGQLQELLEEVGAVAMAERSIERLLEEALDALAAAPLTEDARVGLKELALFVAWRDR